MTPIDAASLEDQAWAGFVGELGDHLAAQWPAMPERLGERYAAFVEHAVQQAVKFGFTRAAAVARYVNLCFVWGPVFQDKPGFEWARGLLAAPREREWATTHQLVHRSMLELQKLPDARIRPENLQHADARLLERFGTLGRQGELHPHEPAVLALKACDLEALELRLLEPAVSSHYVLEGAAWRRDALPEPAPVRVDAANPLPRLVAVLAHPPHARTQTRVQLRSRSHSVCDGDLHPQLDFSGSHGRWRWVGHETRAVNWPVSALDQPPPAGGAASAVAEETSPDIFKLDLQVCGLRDEGDALGAQTTQLWAWPAAQWWVELQREAPAAQPIVAGRAPALAGTTRCRVEADGDAVDATDFRRGFERGLESATAAALQRLLGALTGVGGLAAPRLDGVLALLVGKAALSWGWALGPTGMNGRAFMRLLGQLDLLACQAELLAEGELSIGDGRARLALRCMKNAPLKLELRREAADPPLLPTLLPARVQFSLPWVAELTPLATDAGTLLQATGPCTGALVGEAGLRPRTSGGSGWEWFASLRLDDAALPLALVDPVLGHQRFTHPLWLAQPLLDWSLS